MKLAKVLEKLKKKNRGDYRQFQFCIFFAVMLISSFLLLVLSPLIQGAMPEGGDTRKQVSLIFGVAVVGCTMFAIYAAKLFLRYKSRELGIFLALGAQRGKLKKAFYEEIGKIVFACVTQGILGGAVLAFLIGQIAYKVTASVDSDPFSYTWMGFFGSLIYSMILFIIILYFTASSMRRTNIMDVINEQRKQEKIKQAMTERYLIGGIFCIIFGVFMAMILPQITARVFSIWMGVWTNLFYIFIIIGVYRIMVYSISCHKKGRNPRKYYKNLLNYGMLKFQGASVIKNMMVITFLIIGGLYALYYIPQTLLEQENSRQAMESAYSYRYTEDADELTEKEVRELAKEYGIEVENYRELPFIKVIGDGIDRDVDENGRGVETYYEEYAEYECTSVSEFCRATGMELSIPEGSYQIISAKNATEGVWFRFDDMTKLYQESKQEYLPLQYAGKAEYNSLVLGEGFDYASRFILNDRDYKKLEKTLPRQKRVRQVLFDTVGQEKAAAFAMAVWSEYGKRISDTMNVMYYYNPCEEKRAKEEYGLGEAIFDPNNALVETDWQYTPMMRPLLERQILMLVLVRFIMFSYVFVICLAAVGIISYTRSQTVGISNAQIFDDIQKLGADKDYVRALLKKQVQKIFVLPTVLGTVFVVGYQFLVMYMNDGVLRNYEITIMTVAIGLGILVWLYQYMMYRFSYKKVEKILKLS